MDVKDYCSGLETELMGWKAKLYDAIIKTDLINGKDSESILDNVKELKSLVANIERQVQLLKTECPSDWGVQKQEIESTHTALRSKYDEYLELIGKASFTFQPGFPYLA